METILHAHASAQQTNSPAKQIVRALRGEWFGDYGMARCPGHRDRTPSLSVTIKAGKLLVHCHAGCDQKAVVAALHRLGLWPHTTFGIVTASGEVSAYSHQELSASQRANRDWAQRIWNDAIEVQNTKAENYLRYRGITTAAPPSLRYDARAYWGTSKPSRFIIRSPAVIAAIQTSDGLVSAVQRVFLRHDGFGKAELDEQKKTLGPMLDGAVRLGPPSEAIGLCEGWETGVSAQQLFDVPVWAALGASRMHCVVLPDTTRRVIIFADSGLGGEEAAERTAQVHRNLGREVAVCFPTVGKDFNDQLKQGG